MMFRLVWTLGFIMDGVPTIQKMPPSDPMTIEDCRTLIALAEGKGRDQ